ncbi:hypothetical protein KAM384_42490 [Aeromonas caviae]|nr:hypothetical protein KAM384_42490 [Aeromonas caviae]
MPSRYQHRAHGPGQNQPQRLPPSDVQQTADWANAIWNKATPKERELLEQIVNRPAN